MSTVIYNTTIALTAYPSSTGDLRFRLPVPNDSYNGTHEATSFGLSCPQQETQIPLPSGFLTNVTDFLISILTNVLSPSGEDCQPVLVHRWYFD